MENNSLHILVVDDDDRIRSLLKDYLSENKYIVSTAENAEEAKKKIEIFNFDIIVLDFGIVLLLFSFSNELKNYLG